MTSFHEVQFPSKIGLGYSGGPEYKTVVISVDSASEQRIQQWTTGRHRYTMPSGEKRPSDMALLVAFFHARKGRLYGFRLKDWNDYTCVGQPCANDNVTTTILLQKLYQDVAGSELRRITKPVSGTTDTKSYTGIQLYRNGVPINAVNYSINFTLGTIVISGVDPGAVFTWDGEFDVPVRFDNDSMQMTREGNQVFVWNDITFIEVLEIV